ncbi:LEM domain-containing protein 1 isoform X2 [Talpa occidentalis]|uniref:LEM domain-containing protein 1 isoform X2 n=1 Tax=Talpa occidentalis TaxID=50954 RepID=UPI0023F9717F|nr:LEM domain-containing protein 1 isoform X2 [Talpa occidentalis]
MVDVKCLSDYKLQYELDKLGFSPGPILPSTRRLYEKKLVQLLVSTPCASPVLEEPPERDRTEDCNVSGELNATISLKGNIIFSTEKNKGLKKTLQASTTKPNSLDISCLVQKHSWGVRLQLIQSRALEPGHGAPPATRPTHFQRVVG